MSDIVYTGHRMPSASDPKKSVRISQSDYNAMKAAAEAAGLPWGAIATETLARHFVETAASMRAGGATEAGRSRAVRRTDDRPKARISRIAAQHWGIPVEHAIRRIADGQVTLRGKLIEHSMIFEDEVEELEWQ